MAQYSHNGPSSTVRPSYPLTAELCESSVTFVWRLQVKPMEDTDEDWIPAGEREKLQARFSSSCHSFSWLFL